VVVVGHQATKLKKNIKLYLETKRREVPIEFALNKYYRSGMASSIRAGMKRVSLTTDAVLITLGDKPKIAVSTILSLIHRIPKTRKSIILPIYQGQTGHPVIFKKNYFSQLTSLNPSKLKQDYGARFLIEENQDDILKVKVNDAGVVRDIDTWQDYINTSIEN
jgi:molybdenum cofactor cytidylyltransferase